VQYSKIKPHEEPSDDKIREANNILEEADAVFHIYRPLVACERDTTGTLHPLTKPDTGLPYFEHEAPKGSTLGHDPSAVYVKLGKQRRRLRDGLIRIPFNHRLAVLYDTLAGYTRVGPESDAERIEWLDAQGVVSIYLRDGRQINPASTNIRAAIDAEMDSLAGASVPAVDRSRFSPAGTPPEDTAP
jgi:hypothetical protein